MPLASELELPTFDNTDQQLRGERYHAAMAGLDGHDGWLAAGPFGFIVLDREGGEFFLRTKDAVFPGLTIGELFGIADGPLHEEIVKNIININGEDHRRLRSLVNPALAPRTVDRYRPAMRRFLSDLLGGLPADGPCEFVEAFAKPYPSLVIAEVMGAPLSDAPRLHHWSNWIQRQFDATSLMTERTLIEEARGSMASRPCRCSCPRPCRAGRARNRPHLLAIGRRGARLCPGCPVGGDRFRTQARGEPPRR
jgi:cytochrome P450